MYRLTRDFRPFPGCINALRDSINNRGLSPSTLVFDPDNAQSHAALTIALCTALGANLMKKRPASRAPAVRLAMQAELKSDSYIPNQHPMIER